MKQQLKKDDLSIVIVNFNAGDFLVNCLRSIKKEEKNLNLDIWLVDNNSTDDSLKKCQELFPKINYIINQENIGFGAANNQALRNIKNELVLCLNPDTEFNEGVLSYMVQFMKQYHQVGAATCRVELKNGAIDWASHRGFPTPWASFFYYFLYNDKYYHLSKSDFTKDHEVDAISGAFFLTRKSVLDEVGLFDEKYFMYAEDLDLCYRIKNAGFKIMYVPEVKITHYKGITSGIKKHSQEITTATEESKMKSLNAFYETMKIFYKKNLSIHYPLLINWLVYTGIDLKWLLARRNMKV